MINIIIIRKDCSIVCMNLVHSALKGSSFSTLGHSFSTPIWWNQGRSSDMTTANGFIKDIVLNFF